MRRGGSLKQGLTKDDDELLSEGNDLANENEAEKKRRRLEIQQRFKMQPLDPIKDFNADGTEKFRVRTKLMQKILKMKAKNENEHSEDDMINSFDEECSDVSYDQEVDQVDEEELKARQARKLLKKKMKKQKNKFKKFKEEPGKKVRKPIMNVFCTDYDVVKKAAKNESGFRLREYKEDHEGAIVKGQGGQKLSEEWDVTWHNCGITADFFSKLLLYQKVNQFPGIYQISKKNHLARNLMKMKKIFPNKYNFFPRTWLLPMEASEFRNQFIDKFGRLVQKKKTFIIKPDNLSQGTGIFLSRNYDQIMERVMSNGAGWVAQDYLTCPHQIEDLKYDLRIYVLLFGLNPLRIYIHEQGLARFATEPYEKPKPSNISNMYVHLTNYAINKMNSKFTQNNKKKKDDEYGDYGDYGDDYDDEYGDEEETGHKRSLFAILKIIYEKGGDPDKIFDEIKDLIVKTIISGQPYMHYMYRVCQPECIDNSMAFQILGFDVMIDKNFRPWLIEVNQSPSFATDSPLDYEVKKSVLKDTFSLLNLNQERREHYIKQKNDQNAERIMTGKTFKLSQQEKEKLKEERIEERIMHERTVINQGSGLQLIFPNNYDEKKQAEYDVLLKRAQEIWDEFTTGKNGRKKQVQTPNKEVDHHKQNVQKKVSCDISILNENLNSNYLDVDSEDNRSASQSKSVADQNKNSNHLIQEVVLNDNKLKQMNPFIRTNLQQTLSDVPEQITPYLAHTQSYSMSGEKQNEDYKAIQQQRTVQKNQTAMPFNKKDQFFNDKQKYQSAEDQKMTPQGLKSSSQNQLSGQKNTTAIFDSHGQNINDRLVKFNSNNKQVKFQRNDNGPQMLIYPPPDNYFVNQQFLSITKKTQTSKNPQLQKEMGNKQEFHNEHEYQQSSSESRPNSNPQGSPSYKIEDRSRRITNKKYLAHEPIAFQSLNMSGEHRDIFEELQTFNAQKQYLEDIVKRQEQKIKYYQKIIQQQKQIDDQILKSQNPNQKLDLNSIIKSSKEQDRDPKKHSDQKHIIQQNIGLNIIQNIPSQFLNQTASQNLSTKDHQTFNQLKDQIIANNVITNNYELSLDKSQAVEILLANLETLIKDKRQNLNQMQSQNQNEMKDYPIPSNNFPKFNNRTGSQLNQNILLQDDKNVVIQSQNSKNQNIQNLPSFKSRMAQVGQQQMLNISSINKQAIEKDQAISSNIFLNKSSKTSVHQSAKSVSNIGSNPQVIQINERKSTHAISQASNQTVPAVLFPHVAQPKDETSDSRALVSDQLNTGNEPWLSQNSGNQFQINSNIQTVTPKQDYHQTKKLQVNETVYYTQPKKDPQRPPVQKISNYRNYEQQEQLGYNQKMDELQKYGNMKFQQEQSNQNKNLHQNIVRIGAQQIQPAIQISLPNDPRKINLQKNQKKDLGQGLMEFSIQNLMISGTNKNFIPSTESTVKQQKHVQIKHDTKSFILGQELGKKEQFEVYKNLVIENKNQTQSNQLYLSERFKRQHVTLSMNDNPQQIVKSEQAYQNNNFQKQMIEENKGNFRDKVRTEVSAH